MAKKTSDLQRGDVIHAIIYGPSGAGKTHLIGEFTKAGSVFVNDTDYGIETLAGIEGIEYEQWMERPGVRKPTAWKDMLAFIKEQQENPTYDTYAFDSLTTHCDVAASEVIGRTAPGRELIQFQDYTAIYGKLTTFLIEVRKLPGNVILTAHEDTTRDARGKRLVQPLVLGEKFAPRLPIFWNNIWHISVELPTAEGESPRRILRVNPDGEKLVKTQGDPNVQTIVPTYEAIVAHMQRSD